MYLSICIRVIVLWLYNTKTEEITILRYSAFDESPQSSNGSWSCPWCNGYRRRKWTWQHEFKSWTRLIAFHIALILLGKVWIQLFSLNLWVNSRTDWVLEIELFWHWNCTYVSWIVWKRTVWWNWIGWNWNVFDKLCTHAKLNCLK